MEEELEITNEKLAALERPEVKNAGAGRTIQYDPGQTPRIVEHTIDLSDARNQMVTNPSGEALPDPSSIPSPKN